MPYSFALVVCGSFIRHVAGVGLLFTPTANAEPASYDAGYDWQKKYVINLPAQTVAYSLNELAEQTGAQFLFPYQLASTRPAKAVRGRYTVAEAVRRLLKGSGLISDFEQGVLVITDSGNWTGSRNQNGEESEESMMNTRKKLLASVVGFFVGTGGASGVMGQESAQEVAVLEEVVVTAQKRGGAVVGCAD